MVDTDVIKNIKIKGNPEAEKSKTSIAKERGWTPDLQGDGTGCPVENRPPEGTPRLNLTVKENAYIFFDLRTQTPETVWLELEPGVFTTIEAKSKFPEGDKPRYKVKGTSVNIYGHLAGFDSGDSEAITAIDLSQMPHLKDLFVFKNSLTQLDITNLKELEWLYCEGNKFSSLDLSGNPKLQVLVCKNNQLKTLNLSHNPMIQFIAAQENKLDACDLNRFFESLPLIDKEGLLQIKSNPGAETSKPQLLEGKNWKIDVLGDATGCKSDLIDTAIEDVETRQGLDIYPNPAREYTMVTTQPNALVLLFDAQGTLMARVNSDQNGKASLDLGLLVQGVYFVQTKEGVRRLIAE